ncbi:hypothetical protein QVD17_06968 [Tagetes erecta]|uniref:Uncharacterized protein n=1 Tax=Tagetes erecta TaxID=13708 RepID=A0AAD8LPG8_TARER|nr:hypothetical protein QVD17_06968 [Tagetes erecta]
MEAKASIFCINVSVSEPNLSRNMQAIGNIVRPWSKLSRVKAVVVGGNNGPLEHIEDGLCVCGGETIEQNLT